MSLIILLAFAGFLLLLAILGYNSLVGKRNNVDYAFAGIDAQLKKRCDLIPNLVSAVKAYMKHENATLTQITELRAQAMRSGISAAERGAVLDGMSGAFRNIMVQAEAYPDLKASDNFQQLQRALNETEEQLSAARRAYNAAVTEYNNAIQMFPGSVFAAVFGFTRREVFAASESERANPNVGKMFE